MNMDNNNMHFIHKVDRKNKLKKSNLIKPIHMHKQEKNICLNNIYLALL